MSKAESQLESMQRRQAEPHCRTRTVWHRRRTRRISRHDPDEPRLKPKSYCEYCGRYARTGAKNASETGGTMATSMEAK